jgi:hypothetical protein
MEGMPRGPLDISPAIVDEDTFSEAFRRKTAEKANIDIDWDDLKAESGQGPEPVFSSVASEHGVATPRGKKDGSPPPDLWIGASKALKYIAGLARLDIWGFDDVPMDDLLRPMNLSVLDLAGVDQLVADFVVDKIFREAWSRASTEGLKRPVFFVLEEAHNFVPGGQNQHAQAATIIKRIASEGRKFGLFLVLITQRPYKVHGDTLSQCNSQIIMRLTNPQDQQAVRQSSESISEGLLADLPGLNVGEAVILGPLVRVPVMVRIGERLSKEGGNDIDVVKALERARSEVVIDAREEQARAEKKAKGKKEWKEEV